MKLKIHLTLNDNELGSKIFNSIEEARQGMGDLFDVFETEFGQQFLSNVEGDLNESLS